MLKLLEPLSLLQSIEIKSRNASIVAVHLSIKAHVTGCVPSDESMATATNGDETSIGNTNCSVPAWSYTCNKPGDILYGKEEQSHSQFKTNGDVVVADLRRQ